MLTVGSLFAGIGGFDLGFERAGMRTVWFCEQDEFCRRVLAKHWPGVPCHEDVRTLVADTASLGGSLQPEGADAAAFLQPVPSSGGRAGRGDGPPRDRVGGTDAESSGAGDVRSEMSVPVPPVDVLCGGFPCQDLSYAGRGAGIEGARSGLWREFARLVGELRPRYVVVENVPALAARGLDRVLGDLAACGFDAEWDHLPASAFGAPHRRDRLWLVAYPSSDNGGQGRPGRSAPGGAGQPVPIGSLQVADADEQRAHGAGPFDQGRQEPQNRGGRGRDAAVVNAESVGRRQGPGEFGGLGVEERGGWSSEPDVGRVAHGVPARVDRLRALGNSLVPQIAEWIGRRIIEAEERAA